MNWGGGGTQTSNYWPRCVNFLLILFTLIIPNRVFSQCPPSLFIAPINPVCFNQTSINLSTSLYPGCTLSGPGVSYNISAGYYEFDPSVTGLGTFTLTAFHLICGTQTQTIDVVGPEVIISPLAGSNGKYTKPSGSTITLSASQTGFISISNYTWYKRRPLQKPQLV